MQVWAFAKTSIYPAALLSIALLAVSGCSGKSQPSAIQVTPVVVPIISLSISPTAVLPGQGATLTWSTTSAATCGADGAWSGSKQSSGSINVSLSSPAAQTYSLECTSSSGQSARSSVTLSLSPTEGACTTTHAAVAAAGRRLGRERPRNGKRS